MFDFILKLIETKMKIKIIKMCGLVWVGCEGLWVKNGLEGKADVTLM